MSIIKKLKKLQITYFVHGTTTDNEKNLATGWAPGELSELGIQQSKELGKLVADKEFSAIFCSDLKRAGNKSSPMIGCILNHGNPGGSMRSNLY